MKINNTLEMKANVLNEEDFYKQATREEMINFIEQNFTPHAVQYDGGHYCKNIKYHSIEGFTDNEREQLFEGDLLEHLWQTVIHSEIKAYEEKHRVKIYTKGRMGGWLYVDEAKVLDESDIEERQEDEDDEEYNARMWRLELTFRNLYRFQKWYDELVAEIKEYIKEKEQEARNVN